MANEMFKPLEANADLPVDAADGKGKKATVDTKKVEDDVMDMLNKMDK